jgi:hypothetical protein
MQWIKDKDNSSHLRQSYALILKRDKSVNLVINVNLLTDKTN